jgi:SulP family sulfate permease
MAGLNSTIGTLADRLATVRRSHGLTAAVSAASITVPHALGLGLIAFAPLAGQVPVAALALWSAALPGALLTLLAPRRGVIYAPTTVVALLFAAVVATVMGSAGGLRLAPAQVLAVCGVTVALGFGFQWLFGLLRLASLARFLPISVTHGFAAGVGLAMVMGQVANGFGAGALTLDARTLRHLLLALAVVAIARTIQRRWPHWPGLLPAVAGMALLVAVSGLAPLFEPATRPAGFAWPPLPDWAGVPWYAVVERLGVKLVSLAMLMAIVNSLDVVVFNQELELEHGLHAEPNRALRRESLIGAAFGLLGLIPASTSASRSRAALAQAGPNGVVAPAHAGLLLMVAVTGHWWLPWVPMACLAGALLLSGLTQVPQVMWSRAYARAAPATWSQSWLVALVFAVAGGVGALVAGLVVATFVLLHASASTVLRRALLDGERRSRRLRRAAADAWIAPRMNQVAVFEVQGVVSFGVAAHLAEQVTARLAPRHRRVIIEASRVPAWDATALVRLAALARDCASRGIELVACGLDPRAAAALPPTLHQAADLDRALEWAEDAILAESRPEDVPRPRLDDALGELAHDLSPEGLRSLEALLVERRVEPGEQVFAAGDAGAEMWIVQAGRITLGTAWPPSAGMRLATVGHGMAFGEMAFLAGQPRTACAGSEAAAAVLMGLERAAFDAWAREHPADALVFMSNLAQIGTRRLAATTRQLRAVLE